MNLESLNSFVVSYRSQYRHEAMFRFANNLQLQQQEQPVNNRLYNNQNIFITLEQYLTL